MSVRFMNPTLETEFQRALNVLASSHDTQKKTVSVGFNGDGKRQVRVGYVVERPIWKTSYRLRIDDKDKIFLQGWALVENTSDDDWNDIRMVLVSGKPISFKMNLYDPIYVPPRSWSRRCSLVLAAAGVCRLDGGHGSKMVGSSDNSFWRPRLRL